MKAKNLFLIAVLVALACLSTFPPAEGCAGTEIAPAQTGTTVQRITPLRMETPPAKQSLATPWRQNRRQVLTNEPAPIAEPTVRNPVGIELVLIPAGSFMMGSADSHEDSEEGDERPVHRVSFKYSFYMGKYEVTQAQWRALMGTNPSEFAGDDLPVERVKWSAAQEFIRRLNAKNDGYLYRLPSEAEWEYACRAGTTTTFAYGPSLSSSLANFDGGQPYGDAPKDVNREKTTPVGSFSPNGWGLYDMHGNVFEWCEDKYHDSYDGAPADGSAWMRGGVSEWRVLRGGSWFDSANALRSTSRERLYLDICDPFIGIRLVALAQQ
jgi:formylglycine-generating enzyme required for sulfatase activity